MSRRLPIFVVMATVVAVCLAFWPITFHGTEIKFFIFVTGLFLAGGLIAWNVLAGRDGLGDVFRLRAQKHVLIPALVYLGLAAISIAWANYRAAAALRTVELALYVGWAVVIAMALRSRADLSRLLGLTVIAGVVTAGAAFFLNPLREEDFFLPMENPNWLAACLLIPMMLAAEGFCRSAFAAPRRPLMAAALAGAFALMAAAVYFSGSQSSEAAFVVALVLLPVFVRSKRRLLTVAVIVAVLAAACLADVARGDKSRILSFAHSKSVAIRLDIWRWSVELARRNPVSGLGAGGFLPNVGEVAAPDINRNYDYYAEVTDHAHNEVLEVLVELGALGVIAFLWMVVAPLIGVARLARDDTGGALRAQVGALAAGWLAVFLQSLLDVGMRFWSVPVLFWAGLGMMIAAQRLLREPETHAEPRPVEGAPKVRPEAVAGMVCIVAALVVGEYLLVVNGFRSAVAAAVMRAKPETVTPAQREERLREALDGTFFYLDRLREHEALGRTLASRGAFGAARDEFKTVMRLAGDYHDAELMLASTYLAGNNLMEAMQHLIHYAQLRPSDPQTAQLLVRFRRKKTPAEAMKQAEELIRRYPDFGKVYVAAGLIALDMEPPDQRAADENFEKALRLNLADAHAAYLLGMQKLKKEDYGNALRLLSGSLEMGFRSPALYVNLAKLQEMFGHGAEARELLKDGQRIYPDDEAIRKALGEKRAGAD